MPPLSHHIISIHFCRNCSYFAKSLDPHILVSTKSVLLWVNSYLTQVFYSDIACKERWEDISVYFIYKGIFKCNIKLHKMPHLSQIYILQLKLTLGACFIKPHKKRLNLGPDQCNATTNYIWEFFNFFRISQIKFSICSKAHHTHLSS